jgi:hypothetical protein
MSLRGQALVAFAIALGCCVWNAWALGWKLGIVSAVLWGVWFAIVVGFLVRPISLPEFKDQNEEGLPYISGSKVVLPVLPWATRLSLGSLVATGITIVLTIVLHGQAVQQSAEGTSTVATENAVESESAAASATDVDGELRAGSVVGEAGQP